MYLVLNEFSPPATPLYFSTREGGVSAPPFDSLNLALHTGDTSSNVLANRGRLTQALNIKSAAIKTVRQVHGAAIEVVSTAAPNHWESPYAELPAADGLITATPRVLLSVFVADCFAVYIYDPRQKVIALLHAGWRSVFGGILENAQEILKTQFHSQPADCLAQISPGLQSCCFEIQPANFPPLTQWRAADVFLRRNDKHYFDLSSVIRQRLANNGVMAGNIFASRLCTSCDARLYSYRRESQTGRMAALWGLT